MYIGIYILFSSERELIMYLHTSNSILVSYVQSISVFIYMRSNKNSETISTPLIDKWIIIFIKYKPSEERFKIIHWIKESIRFIFQKALFVCLCSLSLSPPFCFAWYRIGTIHSGWPTLNCREVKCTFSFFGCIV